MTTPKLKPRLAQSTGMKKPKNVKKPVSYQYGKKKSSKQ